MPHSPWDPSSPRESVMLARARPALDALRRARAAACSAPERTISRIVATRSVVVALAAPVALAASAEGRRQSGDERVALLRREARFRMHPDVGAHGHLALADLSRRLAGVF